MWPRRNHWFICPLFIYLVQLTSQHAIIKSFHCQTEVSLKGSTEVICSTTGILHKVDKPTRSSDVFQSDLQWLCYCKQYLEFLHPENRRCLDSDIFYSQLMSLQNAQSVFDWMKINVSFWSSEPSHHMQATVVWWEPSPGSWLVMWCYRSNSKTQNAPCKEIKPLSCFASSNPRDTLNFILCTSVVAKARVRIRWLRAQQSPNFLRWFNVDPKLLWVKTSRSSCTVYLFATDMCWETLCRSCPAIVRDQCKWSFICTDRVVKRLTMSYAALTSTLESGRRTVSGWVQMYILSSTFDISWNLLARSVFGSSLLFQLYCSEDSCEQSWVAKRQSIQTYQTEGWDYLDVRVKKWRRKDVFEKGKGTELGVV